MAATHQVLVDALLDAVILAEDASTASKTLANNANQTMHDKQFAKSFLLEYFDGIKQSASVNGSAVLEELKNELEGILKEAINKAP